MKQLGLGLHNYHDTHRSFPPAAVYLQGTGQSDFRDANWGATWVTMLLPFFEQQALYNQYNFKLPSDNSANRPVTRTEIATLRCPSAKKLGVATAGSDSAALHGDYAKGIMLSTRAKYTNDNGSTNGWGNTLYRGLLLLPRSQPECDITDGTSNTVFERDHRSGGTATAASVGTRRVQYLQSSYATNDAFIVTPNRWINGQKEIYDCPPYCGLET